MASIKSKVNGLNIAIPPNARGVVRRFHTQGGNELIFETDGPVTEFGGTGKPVKIGKTKKAKSEDLV